MIIARDYRDNINTIIPAIMGSDYCYTIISEPRNTQQNNLYYNQEDIVSNNSLILQGFYSTPYSDLNGLYAEQC